MLNAKNVGSIFLVGVIIFKSLPSATPFLLTTEALAISSAVSPEAGTITSLPVLYTELFFFCEKVSQEYLLMLNPFWSILTLLKKKQDPLTYAVAK